jgi:hypothetical protein
MTTGRLSQPMGELCLRWALRLPADVPLPDLLRGSRTTARIREALLAMDDVRDLPRLSVPLLAARTGLSQPTVRSSLRQMTRVGRRLRANLKMGVEE